MDYEFKSELDKLIKIIQVKGFAVDDAVECIFVISSLCKNVLIKTEDDSQIVIIINNKSETYRYHVLLAVTKLRVVLAGIGSLFLKRKSVYDMITLYIRNPFYMLFKKHSINNSKVNIIQCLYDELPGSPLYVLNGEVLLMINNRKYRYYIKLENSGSKHWVSIETQNLEPASQH